MWLARFFGSEEPHHMRVSDNPENLKQWIRDDYEGTYTFKRMGNDVIFIHSKGQEVGVMVKVEVV